MFKKLRNRLVLINVGITTVVIVVAFAAIYISATKAADNRMPNIQAFGFSQDENLEQMIVESFYHERQEAARNLMITLIISGSLIELAVIFASYYLADEAIKPVKEAYDSQKVFIANASHEIKTPLAAIQANLEAADIKENKWIDNVEKEATKLANLNNELLTMARMDLVKKATLSEINLRETVEKSLESFKPRMEQIEFKQTIKTHGKVKIAVDDFTQIFSILMDNAIKYSDKEIKLKLTDHELSIANDGKKIAKKDLEKVFDRFYQVDKSAEGVGLGLSIAKAAAERNGWEITAKTANGKTCFFLKFS